MSSLRRAAKSVPVYQKSRLPESWIEMMQGQENSVLVIDRCGRLTYQVIMPWSMLTQPYVKAAVLSTHEDNPCGPCIAEPTVMEVISTAENMTAIENADVPPSRPGNQSRLSLLVGLYTPANKLNETASQINKDLHVTAENMFRTAETMVKVDDLITQAEVKEQKPKRLKQRRNKNKKRKGNVRKNGKVKVDKKYSVDDVLINSENVTNSNENVDNSTAEFTTERLADVSLVPENVINDYDSTVTLSPLIELPDGTVPIRVILPSPHEHDDEHYDYIEMQIGNPKYHGHIETRRNYPVTFKKDLDIQEGLTVFTDLEEAEAQTKDDIDEEVKQPKSKYDSKHKVPKKNHKNKKLKSLENPDVVIRDEDWMLEDHVTDDVGDGMWTDSGEVDPPLCEETLVGDLWPTLNIVQTETEKKAVEGPLLKVEAGRQKQIEGTNGYTSVDGKSVDEVTESNIVIDAVINVVSAENDVESSENTFDAVKTIDVKTVNDEIDPGVFEEPTIFTITDAENNIDGSQESTENKFVIDAVKKIDDIIEEPVAPKYVINAIRNSKEIVESESSISDENEDVTDMKTNEETVKPETQKAVTVQGKWLTKEAVAEKKMSSLTEVDSGERLMKHYSKLLPWVRHNL